MKDIAREKAFDVLNRLEKQRTTLDIAMEDASKSAPMDRRDHKLFTTLVYGVLRHRGTLDYLIGKTATTPVEKIQPEVRNILRLGLFQIKYLSRIPDSAAVNTSVELSKKLSKNNLSKFVNAVLRNLIRSLDTLSFPDIEHDPSRAIAAEKSFPLWLVQRWIKRWDTQTVMTLCDALNEIPGITIRTNTLKTDTDTLSSQLSAHVKSIDPTVHSPIGLDFKSPDLPVHKLEAFKKGWFQVQDEAAQLISYLLAPEPGERILDACAGLGGKTGHIAQLMNNTGKIIAGDIGKKKLNALEAEMKRLGISIVETLPLDLSGPCEPFPELFDKILVDAPCSGLGVIRRNPDSKWIVSKKNLGRYKKRQLAFLSNCAPLLKTGGVLVYAVCSNEPEENDAVKDAFLHKNKGFKVDSSVNTRYTFLNDFFKMPGVVRTLPHLNNMDGFYAVRFIKT